jgi:hypothetical protein
MGAWIKERSNKKGGEEREKKMMENQFMRHLKKQRRGTKGGSSI